MGKTHNGGVAVGTGFKLLDPQPIADYMVVEFHADLAVLDNQFEGMTVYVKEKQTLWSLSDSGWKETGKSDFSTQVITSGGNYNNLEVTADLLVFVNENAQAILNGIWGKKEFHILNLSATYEVKINHNSGSISGNGQPIKLPTASGNMGIKGTARILKTDGYGYFVADTWGSTYRPEFAGNTKDKAVVVDSECNAKLEDMTELIVYLDAQSMPMNKALLNERFPDAERPFQVVCSQLGLIYMKNNNNTNDWHSIAMNPVA